MMRKGFRKIIILAVAVLCVGAAVGSFFTFRAALYPRPYLKAVQSSGIDISLIYAVAKAESGFNESAKSRAGAIGLMQLMPSTAEFICRTESIAFEADRLYEGEYNIIIGAKYLNYLFKRFPVRETALAAYNAGEGIVANWLKTQSYSTDGKNLNMIPYSETEAYVKKVEKFRKIYDFFY